MSPLGVHLKAVYTTGELSIATRAYRRDESPTPVAPKRYGKSSMGDKEQVTVYEYEEKTEMLRKRDEAPTVGRAMIEQEKQRVIQETTPRRKEWAEESSTTEMWSSSSSRGGWPSSYETRQTSATSVPYTVSVSSTTPARADVVEEKTTTETWTTTTTRGVRPGERVEERPATSATSVIHDRDWRGGVHLSETWDTTSTRRGGSYSTASTLEKTRELDDEVLSYADFPHEIQRY
ncbi:unnamed protein product [Toxocara canis]|uniref:Uncharacterized protein n=1 Tax=Toxocara canis TaxID=6265 RepID=A0A183UYW3_TOXCA|nr:unnamed protein product [Toxocara canis]